MPPDDRIVQVPGVGKRQSSVTCDHTIPLSSTRRFWEQEGRYPYQCSFLVHTAFSGTLMCELETNNSYPWQSQ